MTGYQQTSGRAETGCRTLITINLQGGSGEEYQGFTAPEEELHTLERGHLHIGAFSDPDKLVWHTSADKILDPVHSTADQKLMLQKAVDAIMKSFPEHKN